MDRKTAIDNLVKAVEERQYGETLYYQEIAAIIGRRYGTVSFGDVVSAARRRLIIAGRMIVNMRGQGYKVCPPDEYTGEGVRYMRMGARKIDRGAKIISHAPVNDMSTEAREIHNRVNDRMVRLQAAMAGASVEVHMLSANKNPLLNAK